MARTFKVSVASYTLDGRRVHQAMLGGMPITRELDDLSLAEAVARKAYLAHFGKAELWSWDGDTAEETLIEERTGRTDYTGREHLAS